ncbi:hypothetical protein CTheo_5340 [Ceratobasidium theobromae]|uniref:Uncharacterized protein n=1 Tax=Ceratobasidium theobromae TaxID=1582974 RepID=A0A5N5QI57_9AGAM|nr:hypothetical protein CTheo_5340 [Ceratobasidium theobromae]
MWPSEVCALPGPALGDWAILLPGESPGLELKLELEKLTTVVDVDIWFVLEADIWFALVEIVVIEDVLVESVDRGPARDKLAVGEAAGYEVVSGTGTEVVVGG